MGIIQTGGLPILFTDQLDLLNVDHENPASDWHTQGIDYENDRMVVHVWPNKGAHHSGMTTIDSLDMSTCHCQVKYDTTDEGELMVIHNAESELSIG